MQAVGNIPADKELVTIIESLMQHDPNFKEHLKKLKYIAEREPLTFQLIVGNLDKINTVQ
jgi:hypothetical protein